jgi:uncharacterized protein YraI
VGSGIVIIHLKLDESMRRRAKGVFLMKNRFKRAVTLLLALSMVFALGTSVAFASVSGKTTSNLNKRSSPSTASSVIGTIKKGSTVSVVSMIKNGEKYGSTKVVGDWYKLSDGSFVSADYVTLSAPLDDEEELPPEDEDELPPEDEDLEEVVDVDDDGITIEDGDEITLEDDLDEIPVEDEEDVPPEDDLEEEGIPTEDDGPKMGTVNATTLNMRATPSSSGSIVAKLTRNAIVSITAEYSDGDKVGGVTVAGNWYKVSYNGKTGYVSADYIKVSTVQTGTGSTVKLPIKTTKTVYKTTQKVKVYKLPTTMASTNGTLDSGATVSVQKTINDGAKFTGLSTAVSGKWYQIGSSKYIQAKYVTTSSTTGKSTVEIPLGTVLKTTTAVRQRAKPSTSAAQLAKLEKGTSIVIVGAVLDGEIYNGAKVTGNWVQVKGGGFISADYVVLP